MSETKSFSTLKKEELFDQLLTSIKREILGEGAETLEEMFAAFERGDYGNLTMMSIVTSIMSNGGSVEHLRGGKIPDKLIDFFAERLRNIPEDFQNTKR